MLAERWDRIHARRGIGRHPRRNRRADRARRCVNLRPALARRELRVFPHVAHVVHARVRDTRLVEARDHLRRGVRRECGDDDLAQLLPVRGAARVGREAFVCGEFGPPEHPLAEDDPLALVLQPEHHDLAVACGKRAVRIDRRVRRASARRRRLPVVRVVQRKAHPLDHALQHRHVDRLAAAGRRALDQRGEDVGVRVHARGDVGDRAAGLGRLVRPIR